MDQTIATLKVLGMIPKSGRLCVRKGHLCLDYPEAQSIRRWIHGDSRDCSLMHVQNAVNSAFKIAKFLVETPTPSYMTTWTLERLSSEMQQCQIGLQNLKMTYATDSLIVANLEVLLDRLGAHGSEVVKYLARTRRVETANMFAAAVGGDGGVGELTALTQSSTSITAAAMAAQAPILITDIGSLSPSPSPSLSPLQIVLTCHDPSSSAPEGSP